ncbi:MAG: AAA family ATPase [Gammaproteobacteria bacterium]
MKARDFDPAHETERARSALWSLDAGCPRPEWVRLGMAAKAAGLAFEDWHAWSATAGNYRNEADCRSTWGSMKGEGIGAGTLFAAARAAGWQDSTGGSLPPPRPLSDSRPVNRQTEDTAERARTPQEPQAPRREGKGPPADPAALWSRFSPAPAAHGYLTRKGMAPDGLRIASAGLTIAGHDCAGWLALPVWSIERGELQSLQLVSPEAGPPKLSLPGCRIAGGALVVHQDAPEGRPSPEAFADNVAYLAEGVATAASLYQATGRPAVACFGKGNVDTIARALRQQYPGLRIVLCPDRGAEHQAAAIAAGLGCAVAWVELPEGCPPNFDANDYAAAHGLDGLAELLKTERTPPQRFRLLTPAELSSLPPVRWRIRGVLPLEGIAAIYGPTASGKSFLALDLLAAIAAGREWFGYRVKAAPVLYIALEGEHGISQRVRAHQTRHGTADRMRFLAAPLDLRQPADRADIISAARAAGLAGGVLCIDTLAASAPGMDENASADMGEVIAGLKALQAELGGLVLAVHHAGKDASKGLRGHSSLLGALDAALEVSRTDDRREWKSAKSKDGRDGEAHPFRLEVVELETDDEGEPVTSCVVAPEERAADAVRRVALPGGGNMRLAFDAIAAALKSARAYGMASAPPGRPCIELEAATTAAAAALPCEPKRRRERAMTAITGLVSRGNLKHAEGWLWLP